MNKQNGLTGRRSLQVAEAEVSEVDLDKEYSEPASGTFSIKVTSDEKDENGKDKILYENKEEPFSYRQVNSIHNVIRHMGGKLNDTQIDFVNSAFKDAGEDTGKAIAKIVKLYNDKLKADAKSNAYQALVNKYKPLEGEKKESAQARMVSNAIKLAGVSKETAIEGLKNMGFLPKDYTVADFDSTPLRRTKGDNESE